MSNTSQPDGLADAGRLRAVVVTYEGASNRQTLYPETATETERLTHWLTADADAFVSLEEMR